MSRLKWFEDQIKLRTAVKLSDNMPTFEGIFKAYFIENGVKKLYYEFHNEIVDGARKMLASMICEDDNDFGALNLFEIGGDNAFGTLPGEDYLAPPRPSIIDTDLVFTTNRFAVNRGDLDAFGDEKFVCTHPGSPNYTSTMFTLLVEKDEANFLDPTPTAYFAAGLWFKHPTTSEKTLFASQTFPIMAKTPARSFIYEWEIKF